VPTLNAANYTADERLRDGRRAEIRALKPDDKTDMLAAVSRIGAQSMRRRFFGAKRDFSEAEQAFYLNVDFVNHVALVAVVDEGDRPTIVGGGRYVVVHPGAAEVAFAVVDEYQGQGIGAALLRHLIVIARDAGLNELIAEVLPENAAMLKVFENSGLKMTTRRDAGAVHVTLRLC
jgi:RimJ/RimL family protein N-acetyltransferase